MTPSDAVRVLYVEDAFDQALLVKAFFNTLPAFSVTHAQDGDTAIDLISAESWDILVTDLNLPGKDGFSIIRALRASGSKIPVLVTTGYTQAHYEEQALRAGADHVMIKPLSQADFIERVQEMVQAPRATPAVSGDEMIVVVEGRLGDAEMGCGGSLMKAVQAGGSAVIIPLLLTEDSGTYSELKAAAAAADVLGVEFRADRTLFGDQAGQADLLRRTLDELRPTTMYLPAADDSDRSRSAAREAAITAAREVEKVFAYETATTGRAFSPKHFVDVRAEMVVKMEALAAYQAAGAPRIDLRPRMAQAYARYWGRLQDFTEVEAFEPIT